VGRFWIAPQNYESVEFESGKGAVSEPFRSSIKHPTTLWNVITLLHFCFVSVAPNVAVKIHRFPKKMPIVADVAVV